jgi:hypothetical protein
LRPSNLTAFVNRMRALFLRNRLDRDLDDELAFHLAMRDDEPAHKGTFGNVLRVKEASRDAWAFASFEAILQDIRFGWRNWRQSPGFALVAIITLACGIAVANTLRSSTAR